MFMIFFVSHFKELFSTVQKKKKKKKEKKEEKLFGFLFFFSKTLIKK